MKTIKDYLESLFIGIPDSAAKDQLKADLMANMEDRYNELIAEGKGEHEAIGITITEFGSIDELLEELDMPHQEEVEETFDWGEEITEEEAFHFLANYRRNALLIGAGVLFVLLGVSLMLFIESVYYMEVFGLITMFILIAVAVGCFITGGISMSNAAKEMDDRPIKEEVRRAVRQMKSDFSRSFIVCMVVGVGMCIASVGFIFLGEYFFDGEIGVSMMLTGIGFGVMFLIYGGMIQSSFEHFTEGKVFIADEDEMGPRARREKGLPNHPIYRMIESFYWPIVVAIFFIWGFVFDGWGISWLIFPIAGVLHGGVQEFFC